MTFQAQRRNEMSKLLIKAVKNISNEGLTLEFNEKLALNGGLETNEWHVSWDRIGEALCGKKYCNILDVAELIKLRGNIKMEIPNE